MFKPVEKIRITIFDKIVGQMAVSPDRRAVFEYDTNWLSNGFSISPFYLPLKPDVFVAKQAGIKGKTVNEIFDDVYENSSEIRVADF